MFPWCWNRAMLRPSILTAFEAPSGTSFRSATLTKLGCEFAIGMPSLAPLLLFEDLHRRPPLRETHRGVRGGAAVLVHANIGGVASETDQELVARGMSGAQSRIGSTRALPLFEHRAQRGEDPGVGVIP